MTSRVTTAHKKQSLTSAKPWTPYAYMKRAVKFLLQHAAAGLFLEPGLSKTAITLAAIKILKKEKLLNRVLVIAPLRVCYLVWPAEAALWEDFNELRVSVLHGKDKEDNFKEDADIYVINPEGLPWLVAAGRLQKLRCDTLVIDESSKFKHTRTQRFRLLKEHLGKFRRRWILTGSPNPNGYLDLFGQIFLLDLGKSLGAYITHYRMKYFTPTGYGGYTWRLNSGADKLIQQAIKPLVLRLDAKDYLDLPEVIENVIRVELPEKARKIYDDLEAELLATLEGGHVVTAVSAGAMTNKISQVANGGLYYEETFCDHKCDGARVGTCTCFAEGRCKAPGRRAVGELHNAKTEALVDLVDELQGAPLLVAYEFQHDLKRIRAALGKDLPAIGGGVNMKDTTAIVASWNRGELPVLAAHPAAMGHGLNMQGGGCQHVCWYGITWDYELYDQFNRRINRQGNKHAAIYVHHLVARETVDEAKMRALKVKKRTQNDLLDALRAYARSRQR